MARAPVLAALLLSGCVAAGAPGTRPEPPGQATPAAVTEAQLAAAMLRAGDASYAKRDLDGALVMWQRAHMQDRTAPEPLLRMGRALIDAGSHEDGAELLRMALALRPGDADLLRDLANSELVLQRPEAARPLLERALKLAPRDHRLHNSLGIAHDLAGDHAAARASYEAGLALAPDSESLRRNLRRSLQLAAQPAPAKPAQAAPAEAPAPPLAIELAALRVSPLAAAPAAQQAPAPPPAPKRPVELAALRVAPLSSATAPQPAPAAAPAPVRAVEFAALHVLPLPASPQPAPAAAPAIGQLHVQLASFRSVERARQAWTQLQGEHPELLGPLAPIYEAAEIGDKGLFIQVRVALARAEAEELCLQLRLRQQDCLLARPGGPARMPTVAAKPPMPMPTVIWGHPAEQPSLEPPPLPEPPPWRVAPVREFDPFAG